MLTLLTIHNLIEKLGVSVLQGKIKGKMVNERFPLCVTGLTPLHWIPIDSSETPTKKNKRQLPSLAPLNLQNLLNKTKQPPWTESLSKKTAGQKSGQMLFHFLKRILFKSKTSQNKKNLFKHQP